MSDALILLGRISKAHGLKGDLKLQAHIERPDFLKGKVCFWAPDLSSESTVIHRCFSFKPHLYILTLKNVADRTSAECLSGRDLYIQRSDLPSLAGEEDVFYHTDLNGTPVQDECHHVLGTIIGLQNFGAGDMFIVEDPTGYQSLIPFHHDHVLSVSPQTCVVLSSLGALCFNLNRPKNS